MSTDKKEESGGLSTTSALPQHDASHNQRASDCTICEANVMRHVRSELATSEAKPEAGIDYAPSERAAFEHGWKAAMLEANARRPDYPTAAEERKAIVDWIRDRSSTYNIERAYEGLAKRIEAGDHMLDRDAAQKRSAT